MSLSCEAAPASLLQQRTHRFATCWKIESLYGTTLYFTDHNCDLVLHDAETYTPVGGMSSSARRRASSLEVSDFELKGPITDNGISMIDLRLGVYRNATVTEYVVDWRYPWAGPITTQVYVIADIKFTVDTWEASIKSRLSLLETNTGTVFGRTCRHVLGNTACGVTLASYQHTGLVVDTVVDRNRTFTVVSVPAVADGYFSRGQLQWDTGTHTPFKFDIESFTLSTKTFVLWLPMPYTIQPGDTFTAWAGCDKLLSTCKTKFSNLVNFGGFTTIPGNDEIQRGPLLGQVPRDAGK